MVSIDRRIENLKLILSEMGDKNGRGGTKKLAELAGTTPTYISQLANGHKNKTGQVRAIGSRLAERIEKAAGKAPGWLSESHPSGRRYIASAAGDSCYCVVPTARITEYLDGSRAFNLGEFRARSHDVDTFQTEYTRSEMTPIINAGQQVIIDPHQPVSQSSVSAYLSKGHELILGYCTLKDGDEYLSFPIAEAQAVDPANMKYIGSVIKSWSSFV